MFFYLENDLEVNKYRGRGSPDHNQMKEKTEKCLEDRRRGAKEVVCWRLERRNLEEGEEELGYCLSAWGTFAKSQKQKVK